MDVNKLETKLKSRLPAPLFEHSVRTAKTAEQMAGRFGVDPERAYIVGLLHDSAKSFSDDELLLTARSLGIDVDDIEQTEPYLLHAPIGARLATDIFGIDDLGIVRAISKHTLGAPQMSALDKIAYVSDMIEPGRNFPGLSEIRKLAEEDLDACFAEACAHTLGYLLKKRRPIHPMTVAVWNAVVLGGCHG